MSDDLEYPFGWLESPVLAVSSPSLLDTSSFHASVAVKKLKKSWLCVSPDHQILNDIINTVISKNPKHSPIAATVKMINFTSPKTSTWGRLVHILRPSFKEWMCPLGHSRDQNDSSHPELKSAT